MIFKNNEEIIETSDELKQIKVKINNEDLGFIVTLLSSNQYSKPEQSFIREIVSNAWDSHVAAGNTNQPVVIRIQKDYVQIRDYGTGMNKEDFEKIYCAIGASNKRHSNKFIGGFGLGHYSSLACSDTVNIDDYYNGIVYHYMMVKEGNNIETILLDSENTTEPNGLSVQIDITNAQPYLEALSNIYFFPNVYLDCFDVDVAEAFNSIKIKHHKYYSTCNQTITDRILLGNVSYPLKDSVLNPECKSAIRKLRHCNIVMNFNIGDLEVTPNREEIIYTPASIEKIETCITNAIKELELEIQNKSSEDFDSLEKLAMRVSYTYYDPHEGLFLSNKYNNEKYFINTSIYKYTYRGQKINTDTVSEFWQSKIPSVKFIYFNKLFATTKTNRWEIRRLNRCDCNCDIIKLDTNLTGWVREAIIEQYGSKGCIIVNDYTFEEFLKTFKLNYPGFKSFNELDITTLKLCYNEFQNKIKKVHYNKPPKEILKKRPIKTLVHELSYTNYTWYNVEVGDLVKFIVDKKQGVVVLNQSEINENLFPYYEQHNYCLIWVRQDIYKKIMKMNMSQIMNFTKSIKHIGEYNSLQDTFEGDGVYQVLKHIPNLQKRYIFHHNATYGTELNEIIERDKKRIQKYLSCFQKLEQQINLGTKEDLFWYLFVKRFGLQVNGYNKILNNQFVKLCLK